MNNILLSIDMDEWYQCRWATGSANSLWSDTHSFFKDYYGTDVPIGEIIPMTEKILHLFDEHQIKATFFCTGEIATYYPDLIKEIASLGHEIGSHNLVHKDFTIENRSDFLPSLIESKKILESITHSSIIGYRAPNSTTDGYMIQDLVSAGFRYDSSITPTRKIMGKFGKYTKAPHNPYELSDDDFATPGKSGLMEFPWPVFPIGNLPSGSGIMTRVAGYHYAVKSLDSALKTGDTVYYFHPYEIGSVPKLKNISMKTRLFLRNLGDNYFHMVEKLLKRYDGQFICGKDMLEKYSIENNVDRSGNR